MKTINLLETKNHLHPRWLYARLRLKRGRAGDEFIEINTSKFVDGVYFISIIDNAANVLMTNKFIITK
ncbi:MAG: hypothetical protein RL708_1943 [Bacteroidota bacterium]|jgi:hypothetical protein